MAMRWPYQLQQPVSHSYYNTIDIEKGLLSDEPTLRIPKKENPFFSYGAEQLELRWTMQPVTLTRSNSISFKVEYNKGKSRSYN